jgi:GGDEF domain-containing protein
VDTFLGRALTDPATGLPNMPYFCMIQNWEERRARRRKTLVRVVHLEVTGGAEGARRALLWRLCQELRTSDLIASEGADHFRILLTSPDAENAEAIAERVGALSETLNQAHPSSGTPLTIETHVEIPPDQPDEKGPCDPCEEHELIARPPESQNPMSAFVTPVAERNSGS